VGKELTAIEHQRDSDLLTGREEADSFVVFLYFCDQGCNAPLDFRIHEAVSNAGPRSKSA
jgi:hypothetical protein